MQDLFRIWEWSTVLTKITRYGTPCKQEHKPNKKKQILSHYSILPSLRRNRAYDPQARVVHKHF